MKLRIEHEGKEWMWVQHNNKINSLRIIPERGSLNPRDEADSMPDNECFYPFPSYVFIIIIIIKTKPNQINYNEFTYSTFILLSFFAFTFLFLPFFAFTFLFLRHFYWNVNICVNVEDEAQNAVISMSKQTRKQVEWIRAKYKGKRNIP